MRHSICTDHLLCAVRSAISQQTAGLLVIKWHDCWWVQTPAAPSAGSLVKCLLHHSSRPEGARLSSIPSIGGNKKRKANSLNCGSRLPVSYRHSTSLPGRQRNSRGWRRHETESALAFQLVNGGRCSSNSSQHDRGSRFPGRCCPCMEQPTVVGHVSDVTVDFQATLRHSDVVLMALTSTPLVCFHLPNTSLFSLSLLRVLEVFGLKRHVNLLVNNNNDDDDDDVQRRR